ncbi:RNA polymerase sigma factor [Microbulbifer marinus]|uniref:RNA polymerase, sigma subunit, ECF family n=1 Tax=Microbulbifer marinus TaxID=658218 RepID=A0A1H3XGF2_9GAMM|nr:RNA polymerase sigma factor [Microbulbifer marinus]SDZ98426.1 RNA polymerase, sigma subunit, ECF family [Microbulbifer marinus]
MTDSAADPREPLTDLSDADLVERARRGDGPAFELIVRRHNQALFRAARAVLDDEDQAQEAVQEAYLNAFTHLDSYQGRASLKTWLIRIAVNQAISIKRRQRPVVSLDEKIAVLQSKQSEEDGMASFIADQHTPETAADRQEMQHLLELAIRRLPEIYRSVFMLRAVEGLSVADSAFCLDINEALVKKRLSRARDLLRQDLAQRMEARASDAFEFAGKRCDAVTAHVMAELARQGMTQPV